MSSGLLLVICAEIDELAFVVPQARLVNVLSPSHTPIPLLACFLCRRLEIREELVPA